MEKEKFITKQHKNRRLVFRILGPTLLIIGVICIIVASIDFFTLQDFEEPQLFWLFFVALPLVFVGFIFTGLGYGGAVAKYESREYAPVVKDTFNYLAAETAPGVRELSKAVQEGAASNHSITCGKCNGKNPIQAQFCNHCGEKLAHICPHCAQENPAEASFCNRCGKALG